MKRCPECGFRAKDDTCPLCGVRMRSIAKTPNTHAHNQPGEKCVLPRQEKKTVNIPTARERSRGKSGNPLITIAVIVLIILFRSCAA